MNDSFLIKAALSCSIIGLVCLYFISGTIEVDEKAINKINQEDLENTVLIKGRLIELRTNTGFSILTIQKPETLKVIVFDNVTIKQGAEIEVRGKVEEYRGSYEIIADSIRKIYD